MAAMARIRDLRCPSAQPQSRDAAQRAALVKEDPDKAKGKQQHTQNKLKTNGAETYVNPGQARRKQNPPAGRLSRPVGYVARVSAQGCGRERTPNT